VILCLAVLVELRLVTDTDRQTQTDTDTGPWLVPRMHSIVCRRSSPFLTHFLFLRDFSKTIADTDITNTPLELFRAHRCAFKGLKTETKNLGEIFAANSIFGGRHLEIHKNRDVCATV